MKLPVLVLNQNYQPLNVCNVKRAIGLLSRGKAELMENGRGQIRSISASIVIPSVIRIQHMVKRPLTKHRLSRRAVFHRDKFICQYCNKRSRSLTLDHILPRSQGGLHVWENVVSACIECNHRKAGLTPTQANMWLSKKAALPRPDPYYMFHHRTILDEWRQFIPWLD